MTAPPAASGPSAAAAVALAVPTAGAMRRLGERLAGVLRAGDLVLLTGDLGAGKTTLTQGIGAGLGVRGDVTSPTFVIAREHPGPAGGPALVHVDAYRLGSLAEVDDLDLDTALDDSVTVVEWGSGLVEGLAESRLEVRLTRARGGPAVGGAGPGSAGGPADGSAGGSADGSAGGSADGSAGGSADGSAGGSAGGPEPDEARTVELVAHGPRWAGVRLPGVGA